MQNKLGCAQNICWVIVHFGLELLKSVAYYLQYISIIIVTIKVKYYANQDMEKDLPNG